MKLSEILVFISILTGLFSCSEPGQPVNVSDNHTPAETLDSNKEKISEIKPAILKDDKIPLAEDTLKIAFDANYLMGKFDPARHKDFTNIENEHASKSGMLLRKDVYDAFKKMYEAARKDGVHLKIVSATRPFNYQKTIWEGKWSGTRKVGGKDLSKNIPDPKQRALEILKFSSMPGSSRHHWGTDVDFNNLNNEYFEQGVGLKIYTWLVEHGKDFGFLQVYTPKGTERPSGYNEEKWHWSYQPVARQLTRACKIMLSNEMIKGFKGDEQAAELDVLNNYILGINKECL